MTEKFFILLHRNGSKDGSANLRDGTKNRELFYIMYSNTKSSTFEDDFNTTLPHEIMLDSDIFVGKNCFPFKEGEIYKLTFTGDLINGKAVESYSFRIEGYINVEKFTGQFRPSESWKKEQDLQRKISSLESDRDYWKSRANNLENEVARKDRESKELVKASSELSLTKRTLELTQIANLSLQRQVEEKNELIRVGAITLQTTQQQLTTSQGQVWEKDKQVGTLEIRLDEKTQAIGGLKGQLADLRTENNQKVNELHNKDEEIEKLKNRAGLSQEELLTEKLRSQKRNLELFATELRIDLEQIHNLSRYHERLLKARKNHNLANITTHEDNINRTKRELQNARISIVNIQEICEKCEKIAEFIWEIEQAQQQYEARQEVPRHF